MRIEQVHIDECEKVLFFLPIFLCIGGIALLMMAQLLVKSRDIEVELFSLQTEQVEKFFDTYEFLACDIFSWVD